MYNGIGKIERARHGSLFIYIIILLPIYYHSHSLCVASGVCRYFIQSRSYEYYPALSSGPLHFHGLPFSLSPCEAARGSRVPDAARAGDGRHLNCAFVRDMRKGNIILFILYQLAWMRRTVSRESAESRGAAHGHPDRGARPTAHTRLVLCVAR